MELLLDPALEELLSMAMLQEQFAQPSDFSDQSRDRRRPDLLELDRR